MGILRARTREAAEQALVVLGYAPIPDAALPRGYRNEVDFTWWWEPKTRKAGSIVCIHDECWQAGWFLSADRESRRIGAAMDAYLAWSAKP